MEKFPTSSKYSYEGIFGLLKVNLDHVISQIENDYRDENEDIVLSRGGKFIFIPGISILNKFGLNNFTISVFSQKVAGRYTSYCNNIFGCISEGVDIRDSIVNLCSAISECIIIRGFLGLKLMDDFHELEYSMIRNKVYPKFIDDKINDELYDSLLPKIEHTISDLKYFKYRIIDGKRHIIAIKKNTEQKPIITLKKDNSQRQSTITYYLIHNNLII